MKSKSQSKCPRKFWGHVSLAASLQQKHYWAVCFPLLSNYSVEIGLLTEREPADHLGLPLETAHCVDGDHQRDVAELDLWDLKHECLLEQRVGLTTTNRRLAVCHLLTTG